MRIQFIDRRQELAFLNERYLSRKAEFIPLFGRRRVGKTALLREFAKGKPCVYYVADLVGEKEQLNGISDLLARHFSDTALSLNPFDNWGKVLAYVGEKTKKERLVLIIDEFPYLARVNKAVSSVFQKGWDIHLRNSQVFLVLCGSSVGMMYEEVLAYKAPLYGRRTGQIELRALPFSEARFFFPRCSFEEQVKCYTFAGGIPAYLEALGEGPLEKQMASTFSPNHMLYREPDFLLREELREPASYFSILKAIAFGQTKLNDISQHTGIERTTLSKYLEVLDRLGFVERVLPVTERLPHKSRKGLYRLKDEFFAFWFRFVFPFRSDIEKGDTTQVHSQIMKQFPAHTGQVFETICIQLLPSLPLPFSPAIAGRWWDKDKEIDIVCLDDTRQQAIFLECKWSALSEQKARQILRELQEKMPFVEGTRTKEYGGLLAKKVAGKENLRKEGYVVFDADDLDVAANKAKR